jgi:hypothetical protein
MANCVLKLAKVLDNYPNLFLSGNIAYLSINTVVQFLWGLLGRSRKY